MEFGLYSLGDHMPNPHTNEWIPASQRLTEIIEAAKLAEEVGIDVFSVGESHQKYFTTQAHTVLLSAIAQATKTIKISSSSTIISTSDPVRVFEDFATIDLLSGGRVEIIAGRASRIGLFELLGYDLTDYEALFEEKFALLNLINEQEVVNWHGEYRAPLKNAEILPRPFNGKLPIWRAVGGTPTSAVKAGEAGVPMALAALGGNAHHFKRLIDLYRTSAEKAGYDSSSLPVATTSLMYLTENIEHAMNTMYPYLNKGMIHVNGRGYPAQLFMDGDAVEDVLMVGDASRIIEKILHQHELFGHQRFLAQIDFGGVPFKEVVKTIEIIGNDILPQVKKYTK
ncbi:LLM class flavin-dependent oxidoreductase [Lysinibacillus sp. 3P01SB]|uniref:LLM class flavin-dependent oxidoreductase n=1 Tax=Lysinibacillus sp. 3P01SB TaxID=3132284 RepID=UPI0039A4690C